MWDAGVDFGRMTAQDMIPFVNDALKSCQSVLALSRSPLASSRLVLPALVRDEVAPTVEERSHALFLTLRLAVEKLAPGPARYPFGAYRPLDDPTWSDPRWWRYNLLRHRYLEPLHPDDFVEGGRFTETLTALLGLPSADRFFDERGHAISEVAHWLHREIELGEAVDELEALALQEVVAPLAYSADARQLLEIAATFDEIFPRMLLEALAAAEGIQAPDRVLDMLVRQRFLLLEGAAADAEAVGEARLWLSPALRRHIYPRAATSVRRTRHSRIARAYQNEGRSILAARHFRRAGYYPQAAELLLTALPALVEEMEVEEARRELEALPARELPSGLACRMLLELADLQRMVGDHDRAVAACRAALRITDDHHRQGQIYRRLGKLYEQRNQSHAVNYYRQAMERLAADDPETIELLKDRAWLYILRRQWQAAEADLMHALASSAAADELLRADILDALAGLHRHQRQYDRATEYARAALALRESVGDPLRVAKTLGNLGLIYNDQGDYEHAIAAHEEAAVTYRKLGNREFMLTAMLNVGLAQHLRGRLDSAIRTYLSCLEVGTEIGHHLSVVTTHSNLAEAYAERGREELARQHWQAGYELSHRHGFDDEIRYFIELSQQLAPLQGLTEAPAAPALMTHLTPAAAFAPADLDPDERVAWELVRVSGRITAKRFMDAAAVSKPTATRKLAALVERGILEKHGQGRGTYYALALPDQQEQRLPQPDVAERFQPLQDELSRRYGVTGLAIIEGDALPLNCAPGVPNLVARFATLPDLPAFFALEQRLARAWRAPVKLLPAKVLIATLNPGERGMLTWLW